MDDVRCTLTNGDTVGSTEEQLVFAYGALRSPHVLAAILRRIPKSERCTLVNDWVREALIGMLFRKVTWLSPGTKATYSSGKITNMMSSDCDRLRFVVTQLNLLWIIPLQFFCALGLVIINLFGRN